MIHTKLGKLDLREAREEHDALTHEEKRYYVRRVENREILQHQSTIKTRVETYDTHTQK